VGPLPAAAEPAPVPRRGVPLAGPSQLGLGVALCVVSVAAFMPQVVDASEASARFHHLDHAAQFLLGGLLGLLLGSVPRLSRRLGGGSSLGLTLVIAAPTAMMLLMTPRFYGPLERHPFEHALYHVGIAVLGLLAGLGATRLGLVAGRFALIVVVAMPVMFAAATGGAAS
jgi:hypothetical protein